MENTKKEGYITCNEVTCRNYDNSYDTNCKFFFIVSNCYMSDKYRFKDIKIGKNKPRRNSK